MKMGGGKKPSPGTAQATVCKLSDAKSSLPCSVSALARVKNLSNSYGGIMMPSGLPEPVSIPLSGLLSCLQDKQCLQDDGSNEPGLLAQGQHHTDMPVLLPETDEARNSTAVSLWG